MNDTIGRYPLAARHDHRRSRRTPRFATASRPPAAQRVSVARSRRADRRSIGRRHGARVAAAPRRRWRASNRRCAARSRHVRCRVAPEATRGRSTSRIVTRVEPVITRVLERVIGVDADRSDARACRRERDRQPGRRRCAHLEHGSRRASSPTFSRRSSSAISSPTRRAASPPMPRDAVRVAGDECRRRARASRRQGPAPSARARSSSCPASSCAARRERGVSTAHGRRRRAAGGPASSSRLLVARRRLRGGHRVVVRSSSLVVRRREVPARFRLGRSSERPACCRPGVGWPIGRVPLSRPSRWAATGRSIGKQLFGLARDQRATARDLGRWRACARAAWCTVFGIPSLLWAGVSSRNAAVHDIVFRTAVVHDWSERGAEPQMPVPPLEPVGSASGRPGRGTTGAVGGRRPGRRAEAVPRRCGAVRSPTFASPRKDKPVKKLLCSWSWLRSAR